MKPSQISYRYQLIAVWAFAEVALGGMLHAFRVPFTGIIVGGVAVLLISLLGKTSAQPWKEISKATVLVILVKAGASPHSPLPAYIAVAFQGFLGAAIFQWLPQSNIAVISYATLAMLESAIQKLLIMTLLYGNALWDAFNIFTISVLDSFHLNVHGTATQWAVAIYVGLYVVWGLFLGYRMATFDHRIADYMRLWKDPEKALIAEIPMKTWETGKGKHIFWLLYLFMVVSMVMTLAMLGGKKYDLFYVVFRSMAAIFVVFWVVNPLFKWWLSRASQQHSLKQEIQHINKEFAQLRGEYGRATALIPGSIWCPWKYFKAMEALIALKVSQNPHDQ